MRDYLSEIDERFPIRNSAEQKEAFRVYALEEAQKNGLPAVREQSAEHINLVFGDPASARVIFTAHYDTPRRAVLPNLMLVSNRTLHWAYVFGQILIMLAIAIGAAFGAKAALHLEWQKLQDRMLMLFVYMAVYYLLFFLMMRGPANRRNRNDNTSGTAAVLELTRKLGSRPGIALILFDNEEKGKKGSKAFAADHPPVKQNALIVNMDCVGNGDNFLFCVPDAAESNPLLAALKTAAEQKALPARFFNTKKAQTNSDNRSFTQGIGVCCCRYKRFVGYYNGRIHTARDTVAEPGNIARLTDALSSFAEQV